MGKKGRSMHGLFSLLAKLQLKVNAILPMKYFNISRSNYECIFCYILYHVRCDFNILKCNFLFENTLKNIRLFDTEGMGGSLVGQQH